MKHEITVEPLTEADLQFVAENLRDCDLVELVTQHGDRSVLELLRESAKSSDWTNVAKVNGRPVVVFGVAEGPHYKGGCPWLVATREFETDKLLRIRFARESRHWLDQMFSSYRYLWNVTHVDNFTTQHWLRYLGFTMCEPKGAGVLFYQWR